MVPNSSLPKITVQVPPGGQRLTGAALAETRLLAAAPQAMLSKVEDVSDDAAHGLVAQLHDGPSIYFGDSAQLPAKWNAAAEVLASAGSDGPVYIDVTDPEPARGGRRLGHEHTLQRGRLDLDRDVQLRASADPRTLERAPQLTLKLDLRVTPLENGVSGTD